MCDSQFQILDHDQNDSLLSANNNSNNMRLNICFSVNRFIRHPNATNTVQIQQNNKKTIRMEIQKQ